MCMEKKTWSSWSCGLSWKMIDMPSDIALMKTSLLFPNRYQLQIFSWLGVGLCACLSFSVLGLYLV